jgi:hypothetical protein
MVLTGDSGDINFYDVHFGALSVPCESGANKTTSFKSVLAYVRSNYRFYTVSQLLKQSIKQSEFKYLSAK